MTNQGTVISAGNITGTGIAIGPGATAIVNQAAPAIGVQALHQLPSPPPDFTGREPELAELRQAITTGGTTIVGLRGLDGVGKTALALRLADELKDHFPDGQFFLDLQGVSAKPITPASALAHVIRAYHPTEQLPASEPERRAQYLSVLAEKRALVLMDNARDADQVKPLLPPAGCLLLFTSPAKFALPGLKALNLDRLPAADAQRLLLEIAPRIGAAAAELAEVCGGLPAALRLAGSALAEREDQTPADYLRRLADSQKRLELVDASLSLSYDLLTAEQRSRWCALSAFPAAFDKAGAAAVWELELDAASDGLSELLKYSLVEYNSTTGRYTLHDLARVFADSRLSGAERATAGRRHAEHYREVTSAANALYLKGGESVVEGLALFDQEFANIRAGQAWAVERAEQDESAARLAVQYPNAMEHWVELRLHAQERIAWLTAAVAAARKLDDPREEGIALILLGNAYGDLGNVQRAIEFYEQRLVIARATDDRHGEGYALASLGIADAELGNAEHAIELFEQALVILREIGDRRGEGILLINLGNAYAALGEVRRAIEFYEETLVTTRKIGDREQEGAALGSLGIAYGSLGEPRKAIEYQEQALVILREIGDRQGEGNALWNMSLVLESMGGRDGAIAAAQAALTIFEQIEDPGMEVVRQQLTEWQGKQP